MGRRKLPRGVRVRSDSSIQISFTYEGQECRESLRLVPTPTNLKRAANHRIAILDAIDRGTFDYATTFPNSKRAKKYTRGTSIKFYLSRWIKEMEPHLKASTYATHKRIVTNQLIKAFGRTALHRLTWKQIKDWSKKKDVSQKTMNNILSVLRTALDEAVEDELIEFNPMNGKKIRKKRTERRTDEIDPFSYEEREAIIKTARGQEKNLIQFGFWTGLRISELCALDWGKVDWIKGTVRVEEAFTQAAKKNEAPKTDKSVRDVKLLAPALTALKDQKAYTYLKGEEIFQNERQGRWAGDASIRTMWTRVLKRAKVRYRYPYQMRHTYASTMLMAEESVMWVSDQLGHTDWSFTARTYSRFISDDAPQAGMKAESAWEKRVERVVR